MKTPLLVLPLVVALGCLSGCVTHISTDVTQNPPPAEKLSNFTHFQLDQIALPAPYAGQTANERARTKIQENVSAKLDPVIVNWNTAAPAGAPVRTLEIEPTITEIKFINATARVWAGPIAGSSAVVMKAAFIDKETNKVIAEPVFYARAAAWGGTFSFGTTDNLMLTRLANRLSDYVTANYAQAVGGPSGAEPAK